MDMGEVVCTENSATICESSTRGKGFGENRKQRSSQPIEPKAVEATGGGANTILVSKAYFEAGAGVGGYNGAGERIGDDC